MLEFGNDELEKLTDRVFVRVVSPEYQELFDINDVDDHGTLDECNCQPIRITLKHVHCHHEGEHCKVLYLHRCSLGRSEAASEMIKWVESLAYVYQTQMRFKGVPSAIDLLRDWQ